MRLERIDLRRTPGIDAPYALDQLAPGLNLVLGPNGIGKSSLARAIRATLWPKEHGVAELEASSWWRVGESELLAHHGVGGSHWQVDGQRTEAPSLPGAYLGHCLLLPLVELELAGAPEKEFVREIRRQLSGGYDLAPLREAFALRPMHGRVEERELRDARRRRVECERSAADLELKEARRAQLDVELQEAHDALHEQELVSAASELSSRREELRALESGLEQAAPALEKILGDEVDRLADLRRELAERTDEVEEAERRLQVARERVTSLGITGGPVESSTLDQQHTRVERLRTLERELSASEDQRLDRQTSFDRVWKSGVAMVPGGIPVSLASPSLEKLEDLLRLLRERAEDRLDKNLQTRSLWFFVLGMVLVLGGVFLLVQTLRPIHPGWAALPLVVGFLAFARARAPSVSRQALLGLDPDRVEEIEDDLRGLAEEVSVLDAQIQRRRARAQEDLSGVNLLLEGRSQARAEDAVGAAKLLRALQERSHVLRAAEGDVQRLTLEHERGTAQLESLRARIAGLFAELGLEPDDDRGLARRFEEWPRWREAREEKRRLERTVAELEQRLADRPELQELSPSAARDRLSQVKEQAERIAELSHERGAIETELSEAARSTALENVLAGEATARAALAERREQALFATAGTFLLEAVERERDESSTPAVLRRAQELFAEFTRGRFELKVAHEDGRLYARDAQRSVPVRVGELSGGTRAQLLLAARLAFLQHAEGEHRLPIVLDEALATSDPERFAQVAKALLRQCDAEGRQLFYFGARSDEIPRWREACQEVGHAEPRVIDLARVRGDAAAVRDPGMLQPVVRRLPPPTLEAADYGAEIDVPRPDPFAAPESWHLFHLLRDDLSLLRRLQGLGIESLGQWRTLTGGGRVSPKTAWVSEAEATRLEAWASVVASFLDHWRVGRSRPLERRDLEGCAAISQRYIDEVDALRASLGGDSVALMGALRERQVKGLRTSKIDELEEYLRAHTLYDERERQDEDAIAIAVLRDVQELVVRGSLGGEAVRARVACLWALVGSTSTASSDRGQATSPSETPEPLA